jgi:hypothetical protein
MSRVEELQTRRENLRLRTRQANEEAMAWFCAMHLEYLQAELDFYTDKDEKKNLTVVTEDEKKNLPA